LEILDRLIGNQSSVRLRHFARRAVKEFETI